MLNLQENLWTKPGKGEKSSSWPLIFHLGPLTCWWVKLPRPAAGGIGIFQGDWVIGAVPPSTHPWLPPAPPQRRGGGSYCPACRRATGGKSAPREPEKHAATRLGKWSCVPSGRGSWSWNLVSFVVSTVFTLYNEPEFPTTLWTPHVSHLNHQCSLLNLRVWGFHPHFRCCILPFLVASAWFRPTTRSPKPLSRRQWPVDQLHILLGTAPRPKSIRPHSGFFEALGSRENLTWKSPDLVEKKTMNSASTRYFTHSTHVASDWKRLVYPWLWHRFTLHHQLRACAQCPRGRLQTGHPKPQNHLASVPGSLNGQEWGNIL